MMSDPFEHIDDYKQNLLSESDKALFEEAMAKDPSLQFAVDHYELAEDISLSFLDEEVRIVLNGEGSRQKLHSKKRNWLYLIILGVLILLSVVIYKYFEHTKFQQRVQFAMDHYTPPQVVFQRNGSELNETIFSDAKLAFSKSDYKTCQSLLEKISPKDRNDEYYWIAAHTSFILGDIKSAKELFQKIEKDSTYYDDVENMLSTIYKIENR